MRVLVTGSLGTLGVPLVDELRGRGHDVFGCDIRHSADDQFMRADVADYRQLERVFQEEDFDVVYHLAAEFGRINGEDYYEDCWRSNAIGTRNVLELCHHHNSRLVFSSSSEIYGEFKGVLKEDLPETEVLRQPNEYALSKWANEVQIKNFQERHGLDAVRLRFFNAYGPGEYYTPYRSVVALFCHNLLNDQPIDVYGSYYRSFIYVDDLISTTANVCEQVVNGVYNIGGKDFRSIEELAHLVLANTDADPQLLNWLTEDRMNVKVKRASIKRAEDELDHNPITLLEDGVPKTLEWMRQCGSVAA
jgi:dTDP-glucose 4,6-dehydratase